MMLLSTFKRWWPHSWKKTPLPLPGHSSVMPDSGTYSRSVQFADVLNISSVEILCQHRSTRQTDCVDQELTMTRPELSADPRVWTGKSKKTIPLTFQETVLSSSLPHSRSWVEWRRHIRGQFHLEILLLLSQISVVLWAKNSTPSKVWPSALGTGGEQISVFGELWEPSLRPELPCTST